MIISLKIKESQNDIVQQYVIHKMLSLLTQCTMFCFTCFANVLPFKIFISSSSKSPSLLFALTCDYCTCLSFFASQSCSLLQMEVHCPLRTSLKRCWGTEWEGGVDAYELRSASLPLWKPVFRGRFLDFSFSMDPFHPGLLGSL